MMPPPTGSPAEAEAEAEEAAGEEAGAAGGNVSEEADAAAAAAAAAEAEAEAVRRRIRWKQAASACIVPLRDTVAALAMDDSAVATLPAPALRRAAKRARTAPPKPVVATSSTSTASSSTAGSPPAEGNCAVISKIIEHHRCPILQQLLVDPVLAEDGHVYERRALEQWLMTKEKSPVTNKPMGSTMMPAIVVRQTVSELIEGGMLDDDTSRQFFVDRGGLRATRTAPPGPDLEGARADFTRARQLAQRSGRVDNLELQLSMVAWMQQGVDLFTKANEALRQTQGQGEDLRKWLAEVGNTVQVAVTRPLSRRMTKWQALPKGTRVRIIDDATELERLCRRAPAGAREKVGWLPEMLIFAGQVCTVEEVGEASHMNYSLRRERAPEERTFSFPYDALILPA